MRRSLGKVLSGILCVAMVCSVITVTSPTTTVEAAAGKVKSVKVTNLPAKTLTLKKGKSKVLKVKVETTKKSVSKEYTFKSSKKKVVSVVAKGKNVKVKGLKKGTSKITIASKVNPKKKTVIKVTVGNPVKKVAFNASSASLYQGDVYQLTPIISKKKASNKKVIFKSSNESVAKVTKKKGLVTAVAPGKATITAVAADGSGKKAKFTVTVKQPNTVSSINIVNDIFVEITLKEAQKLTKDNFTIMKKLLKSSTYKHSVNIADVITNDNKTYYIALDTMLDTYSYISVSVKGLLGNKNAISVEKQFLSKTEDSIFINEYTEQVLVGTYYERQLYFEYAIGYVTAEATGIPEGMQFKASDWTNEYNLVGQVNKKGVYDIHITAVDEIGVKWEYRVILIAGTNQDIIVYAEDVEKDALYIDGNVQYANVSTTLFASGGIGGYTYSFVGEDYGLSISSSGNVEGDLPVGEYQIKVKVEDSAGNFTQKVINFKVNKSVIVSGKVRTKSGIGIPEVALIFINTDEDYFYNSIMFVHTQADGTYTTLIPTGKYNILVNYIGGLDYPEYEMLANKSITSNISNLDFVLDLYKLTISLDSNEMLIGNVGAWCDSKGVAYGAGNTVFVPAGHIKLRYTYIDFPYEYSAMIDTNVTKDASVIAHVTRANVAVLTLSLDTQANVNVDEINTTKYMKFTPETDGTYYFYSVGGEDPKAILYSSTMEELEYDDDSYGRQFEIEYNLIAGETYYLEVESYASVDSIAVCVSQFSPYQN